MKSIESQFQSAIWKIICSENGGFYGAMLQEITIRFNPQCPTAAMGYDKQNNKFQLILGNEYFERVGKVLRPSLILHEVLHFAHGHLFRMPFEQTKDRKEIQLWNIAADMAINQYIDPIAKGCPSCPPIEASLQEHQKHYKENTTCPGKWIDVNDWRLADGTPFPKLKTMEQYVELLKDPKVQEQNKDKMGKKGKGKPGEPGEGTGEPGDLDSFDEHFWDDLSEEEKEKMLKEAKDLVQRTIEKTSNSHTILPDAIKDLLKKIEGSLVKLNYKNILRQAIKRTLSVQDRETSWNRKNKRYGFYSPGSIDGKLPKVKYYGDTSGSISHKEMNGFLTLMDGFTKAGAKVADLALWHTSIYYNKRYSRSKKLLESDIQSGGTDVMDVLKDIKKVQPNLAIIHTDGYYSHCDINLKNLDVIWIISEGGSLEHPNKHIGITIPITGLK